MPVKRTLDFNKPKLLAQVSNSSIVTSTELGNYHGLSAEGKVLIENVRAT